MKKLNFIWAAALVVLMSFTSVTNASIEDLWITIDDETNKPKSVVKIFKKDNGKYYGKVLKVLNPSKPNPTCEECTDDRKDQPVEGMEILRDLTLKDGQYSGGTICDPKNGKVYKCKMWVDEENDKYLQVRGYLGPFYRTQKWLRKE